MDIRKIIIIFVVAVLFSVFVFSVIEAVYPTPKWDDFCRESQLYREKPYATEPKNCPALSVKEEEENKCIKEELGRIAYKYDSKGCAVSYYCETCDHKLQQANEQHSIYVFYISAILALIAIFVGMYLPAKANTLNEWIGTGFMLGGTFALFFGTLQSFQALDRIVRPIVIFLELALVIFLAYKKVGNLREDRKKR